MKKPTIKRKTPNRSALKVVKKAKVLSLPTKITSHSHTKCSKKNTPAYYHCLAEACQGQNITKACKDCKQNAQSLANLRQQEITNIKAGWKQMGLTLKQIGASLSKLIPKS